MNKLPEETMTDPLTNHTYDGIQEYDNPLPGWWKWMFIGSIVFSIFYAMFFHMGAPGRSMLDQYDVAFAANTRLQFSEIGDLEPTRETLLSYMQEDRWLRVGQVVYKTNCITCHGRNGEGVVGPNLTDEFYKHVKNVEDIAKVINEGAANGAMPAWANRLHQNEIVLVSCYIASLRGENVEGGKGPEGNAIAPWPRPTSTSKPAESKGDNATPSAQPARKDG